MRQALFEKEAQAKLMVGFDRAAKLIGGTLGPYGRNVALWDEMTPRVVNDGATIAKEGCVFEDPVENFGAWFVRNTSSQTADDAGDGTTTTAVLLQALVHESLKRPESPIEVGNSLLAALPGVVKAIKDSSKKLKDEDIEHVAFVSAEHKGLARVITKVIKERGKDLLFVVEDNREGENIQVESVVGYEAHVGWALPIFITDKQRARAVYEDMPVLVSEKKILNHSELKPIFDQLASQNITKLCVVAFDWDEAMLGTFALTHARRAMSLLVVRATGPLLEDIAGTVGATRVSDQEGVPFAKFDVMKHLGVAKKIVCGENKTLFVPANREKALAYSNILESRAANDFNQFRKDKLQERVAKIRSGVAVIKVGAPTDTEREYLKLKADDAARAVKCAIEEGTVEGGGRCLWRIAQNMKPKTIGEQILKKALMAPLRTIVENGGGDYSEYVAAMKPIPEVLDPAKVERVALTNAVSTAAKMITTFAVITPVPPKQ